MKQRETIHVVVPEGTKARLAALCLESGPFHETVSGHVRAAIARYLAAKERRRKDQGAPS